MNEPRPLSPLPNLLEKLGRMTSIRDTHLLEQSLLRSLGPLLGVSRTSLYRVDDNHQIIRALHHEYSLVHEGRGVERVEERIEEILSDREIPESTRNLLDNVRMLGRSSLHRIEGRFLIAYPLLGGGDLRGFFAFEREREPTPTDDAVVRGVLEVFSNYYALLDTSQRDRLTGLLNRYSLELNLDRLWAVLSARLHEHAEGGERREGHPHGYWVALIDIDHFKKINDNYGHMIGDEVLILVTQILARALRRSDLLYRYGGEEFVAVIAANTLDDAMQAFERARTAIDTHSFPQVGQVTLSMGFSGADPSVLPQVVINRADRALYQAKGDGRNRVYHFETLIDQGILQEMETGDIDLF